MGGRSPTELGVLKTGRVVDLPVIDVSAADAPRAIDEACREIGFFYVVGHGVDPALQDASNAERTSSSRCPTQRRRDDRDGARRPGLARLVPGGR